MKLRWKEAAKVFGKLQHTLETQGALGFWKREEAGLLMIIGTLIPVAVVSSTLCSTLHLI